MKGRMPVSVEPGYLEHLATNRYFDRTFDCDAVKVLPGEYFVTTADILLVTVLGSCVTACIRDIVTAGGIPTRASVRARQNHGQPVRFCGGHPVRIWQGHP